MSNEQFQMLMDLVGGASDSAFWLVVVFFSVKIIGWAMAVGTILTIVVLGCRLIHSSQFEADALQDIYREVVGKEVSHGYYAASDHRNVINNIRNTREK
jgi:hypothetical protein